MEDEGLLKTKKKNTLTDEKRAQIATRMRELNDKRILDAATKIMNTLKPAEPPAPVIETTPIKSPEPEPAKPEPTPTLEKPKKKRIIQIVQLESDDDEDEPMELIMPKKGSKAPLKPPPPEPEPEKPKPKAKPKPKPKPVEPPKQPLPPMVRCRFL